MIDEDGQAGAFVVIQVIAERDLGVARPHDQGQLGVSAATVPTTTPLGTAIGKPDADCLAHRQPQLMVETTEDASTDHQGVVAEDELVTPQQHPQRRIGHQGGDQQGQ